MVNVKSLCFTYADGTKAINDMSFHIYTGEKVAIIGTNGAGKSTLFLSIVGILTPQSGCVTVDNLEVNKNNLNEIRSKVGIVFQNSDNQLFMTRVYDDVAFAPRNYKVEETEVECRINTALESLNITHLKNRMCHKLSEGEKKRVAIAGVLTMNPKIMILDEPTSFLDPRARKQLIKTLCEMPLTQVIATHDLDMALEVCQRVIVLNKGTIVAEGSSEDILRNEEVLHSCGLELPISLDGVKSEGVII